MSSWIQISVIWGSFNLLLEETAVKYMKLETLLEEDLTQAHLYWE